MSVSEETFGILNDYTPEKAIAGAYYALRLIRHRAKISSLPEGLFVESVQSEPLDAERFIALIIIKEIEKLENISILKLGDIKAKEYSLKLSKVTQERANQVYGRNKEKGKELLAQLRTSH